MADLVVAGYGPAPAKTLTWRQFWFHWYHLYLRRVRDKRETLRSRNWAALRPVLENTQVQQVWAEMEAADQMADVQMLVALWQAMPPSLRAIIINPHHGSAGGAVSADEKWRRRVLAHPPGSPARRFQWAGWATFRAGHGMPPPDVAA